MCRHLGFTQTQAMGLTRLRRVKVTQVIRSLTPVPSKEVTAPNRRHLKAVPIMIQSAPVTVTSSTMGLGLSLTLVVVVKVTMVLMQMMVMTVNVESAE